MSPASTPVSTLRVPRRIGHVRQQPAEVRTAGPRHALLAHHDFAVLVLDRLPATVVQRQRVVVRDEKLSPWCTLVP